MNVYDGSDVDTVGIVEVRGEVRYADPALAAEEEGYLCWEAQAEVVPSRREDTGEVGGEARPKARVPSLGDATSVEEEVYSSSLSESSKTVELRCVDFGPPLRAFVRDAEL